MRRAGQTGRVHRRRGGSRRRNCRNMCAACESIMAAARTGGLLLRTCRERVCCMSGRCSICTTQDDLRKFRQVADQTSALVRQFKGSLSAEHGVGIARTEYMREQLGDELLDLMREIKRTFDPKNIFNPGKIFSDGRSRIDAQSAGEFQAADRAAIRAACWRLRSRIDRSSAISSNATAAAVVAKTRR